MALAMGVFMFSLAGIPPLAGFFAKLYVFLAAVNAELYALAVIGVLASVVGAFYYLRIIKIMYFDAPSEGYGCPGRTRNADHPLRRGRLHPVLLHLPLHRSLPVHRRLLWPLFSDALQRRVTA